MGPVSLWLVPLRHGPEAVGVLAIAGRRLEPTTLKALASVIAIAIERVRLLEQRQRSEVERRSVDIKSALLGSLAHDLRTPLTAMTAAISNLRMASLNDAERARQAEVALEGLNRLTRLFENILEMASLDAGGITPSLRWVHASEATRLGRKGCEHALRGAMRSSSSTSRRPGSYVLIRGCWPPRLRIFLKTRRSILAAALAAIPHDADRLRRGDGLVDDSARGLPRTESCPRIFERFLSRIEGRAARRSGAGMGGWPSSTGSMQAQGGRVSAEEPGRDQRRRGSRCSCPRGGLPRVD